MGKLGSWSHCGIGKTVQLSSDATLQRGLCVLSSSSVSLMLGLGLEKYEGSELNGRYKLRVTDSFRRQMRRSRYDFHAEQKSMVLLLLFCTRGLGIPPSIPWAVKPAKLHEDFTQLSGPVKCHHRKK